MITTNCDEQHHCTGGHALNGCDFFKPCSGNLCSDAHCEYCDYLDQASGESVCQNSAARPEIVIDKLILCESGNLFRTCVFKNDKPCTSFLVLKQIVWKCPYCGAANDKTNSCLSCHAPEKEKTK